MASIVERTDSTGGKSYLVRVRIKGQPAQSQTFSRLTDARKWALSTEAAIQERRHFPGMEAKRHTFGEMIDKYIRDVLPTKGQGASHRQLHQLIWWKEHLGAYTLDLITPVMLADARDTLLNTPGPRGRKRSNSTTVRYLAALSHCYTLAVREWAWVDSNPVQRVTKPKEPRGRLRFLSDDEQARLLNTCQGSDNPDLFDVVILALSTGMRQGEILALTWRDIDFKRGTVTVENSKNGDRRLLPLAAIAYERLEARSRLRRLRDNRVFFVTSNQLGKAFPRAVAKAGIENFKFHDLRHCAASYLAMGGASLAEISAVLGHRTLAMVSRYSHLSEEHLTGVVSKMNAVRFATPELRGEGQAK